MEQPNGFAIFMVSLVVIGIPVIFGVGYAMLKTVLKHKEKMASALNAQAAEKAAQYAAHTERLEQRMRVLERIVTDRGIDVATEIEKLRDEPLQLN
jgi:LytS/YehU family sensor histidine kinase